MFAADSGFLLGVIRSEEGSPASRKDCSVIVIGRLQHHGLLQWLSSNLPAVQETRVRSLGQEDPLEEEMTTHSSVLSWKIPWTEEPGGLQSTGSQRVRCT